MNTSRPKQNIPGKVGCGSSYWHQALENTRALGIRTQQTSVLPVSYEAIALSALAGFASLLIQELDDLAANSHVNSFKGVAR